MVLQFIILALCGIVVGILSGLLGIGGGMVVIPLLRLGFGFDALIATGTSLFTIIPTSISGVVGHLRNHTALVKLGLLVGLCGAVLSPVGTWCANKAGGLVIMIVAGAVIVFSAVKMIRKAFRKPAGNTGDTDVTEDSGATQPAQADGAQAPVFTFTPKRVVIAVIVGVIAGFLSGFIGVGGGFIIIPLLTIVFGLDMKHAAGTSLVSVFILAIPGAIAHGMLGEISWIAGIAIAVGAIPGAFIGAALSKRVPDRVLRLCFGILLGIAGVTLVVNEFV